MPERLGDIPDPLVARLLEFTPQGRGEVLGIDIGRHDLVEAIRTGFQTAQRFLQRLLESAADGHDLADRFHLRGQARLRVGELLEREARHLGDDIVDGRLERRRYGAAGNLVAQFVERVATGQLGRHFGDRKTGRLGGERRGAGHARVHLDHGQATVVRIDGELDVRAAGIDADLAQHLQRGVTHDLVFLVRQRLCRRDRDGVAGMHAHRIQILDRADDDAVVRMIADHLHFEFLPAEHGLFQQDLVRRRQFESALADVLELLAVEGDTAPGAPKRERRANDHREADPGLRLLGLIPGMRDPGRRCIEADLAHGRTEPFAVLGHVDRILGCPDHLDAVFLQHAVAIQIERAVERGLPAHGRQQRVGLFLFDDALDHRPVQRLDIDRVRHAGIGHDRGRIRVHQDDPIPLLDQRLAGLGAGVVELAGLTDDDRSGAEDQDALDVGAFRHGRARIGSRSRLPGEASGSGAGRGEVPPPAPSCSVTYPPAGGRQRSPPYGGRRYALPAVPARPSISSMK